MLWLILISLATILFSAIPLLVGHFLAWLYGKLTGAGHSPRP